MTDTTNAQVADALDELGDLYELDGAIIHRVVAYRNAAKVVRDTSVSVAALALAGRATELAGIGATLQEKIVALEQTGEIPATVKLRAKFPAGLVAITRLPGLGPKRARRLYEELGVDSAAALRAAAQSGRIADLKGFGAKAQDSLLAALDAAKDAPAAGERVLLSKALEVGEPIVEALRAHPSSEKVELAGSARRMADTVKDLDIIATATDPAALIAALGELEALQAVSRSGEAGARAVTHTGLGIDLRIVEPDQFGNLLQHFSGSKEHNVKLREAAVKQGLHVSEYGVLDDASGTTHRCATEADVYALLGYSYIEPELREGRGELAAAAAGGPGLPDLITAGDLKGELHCHTFASDGQNSIEEMALAARKRGLSYVVITDHSATHGFGDDVSPDQLRAQIERVREVDAKLKGIKVLIGSEVNIQADGTPDYDDELLAQLDWAIGSVHTSFAMDQARMTARIVSAIEHPLLDAIGHPTGRMIGRRPGYPVDMEAVIEAAARTGTMLEINSNPNRRDLSDVHARAAAQAGVPIIVTTDAHSTRGLAEVVRYGIATARRAWLTADQVANTRSWRSFAPLRKRARGHV